MAWAAPGDGRRCPGSGGPMAYTDGVAHGAWHGYSALPLCLGFAWPSCLVPWPFWRGLRRADAASAGRGSPSGLPPAEAGAWDRNILAIYSEYTMYLQLVTRRSRALWAAAAPPPARTQEPARLPASCAWELGFPWRRGCHERRLST